MTLFTLEITAEIHCDCKTLFPRTDDEPSKLYQLAPNSQRSVGSMRGNIYVSSVEANQEELRLANSRTMYKQEQRSCYRGIKG